MVGKRHDPWAVRFAANHTPVGGEFLPWPTRVPPVALAIPDRLDVRAWKRPFDLVAMSSTVIGLACSPWLLLASPWRIKAAGALLTALFAVGSVILGAARFQADETGVTITQPLSRHKLAWRDIAAVSCPEPRKCYRARDERQFYAIAGLDAAILFGALIRGGLFVDIFTDKVSKDLVQVLQAIIILFVAMELLFKRMFTHQLKRA